MNSKINSRALPESSDEYHTEEIEEQEDSDIEIIDKNKKESSSRLTLNRATFIERVAVQRERQRNRRHRKTTIICRDCSRTFASKDQLLQHYGGIAHKRKIKEIFEKTQEYFCKTCDLHFERSHDFEGHNKGKRHRSASRRLESTIRKKK